MDSENHKRLRESPIVVWLGIISSLIAIFAFITGYQSLSGILAQATSTPVRQVAPTDTPEATSLPVAQQPQVISTNTVVSPKKAIVGLWERRQSGYLEHYNFQNDGSYTIEARDDGSNVIIASNYGTFTFDKDRIYSTDKDSAEFAESYYLDNGGDLLVINNKVELAWTRVR
jgi:hypothetical protein